MQPRLQSPRTDGDLRIRTRGSIGDKRSPKRRLVHPGRTIRLIVCAGVGFALSAGCVRVNPGPDYRRTSDLINERVGVDQSYDPDIADAEIEQKVEALLDGGLTAEEAVQVALLNNRRFQALFENIGVSRAEVVQSGLLSNPTLGLSLRFPEGGGLANLSLGFAQQIADLWQIPVRKQIAEKQLEETILTVAHEGLLVATKARVDFYGLLALQQAEQITEDNLGLAERSAKLTESRFAAGEVGRLDVNLARANLLDVRRELLLTRRDRELARQDLAYVLGLSRFDGSWTLSGRLANDNPPEQEDGALLAQAMQQRLDARVAALRVESAERELRKQVLAAFPDATLGFEFERPEQRALPGRKVLADTARASAAAGQLTAPDIQSRGERRMERSQIIDTLLGPTLDITLPIWHQNQAQIARAKYEVRQRRKEYEDLLDTVALELHQALTSVRGAREVVALAREQTLPLAEQNVESARQAYQAGEQSVVALIEAQKALIAQRRQYVEIQRDYAITLAELRQALGGESSDTADELPADTSTGK